MGNYNTRGPAMKDNSIEKPPGFLMTKQKPPKFSKMRRVSRRRKKSCRRPATTIYGAETHNDVISF